MRPLKLIYIIPALFLGAFVHSAYAQEAQSTFPQPRRAFADEWQANIGLKAGHVDPDEKYDGDAEIGLTVGYQAYVPFSWAFEVSYAEMDQTDVDDTLNRTKVMLKGNYNFAGSIPVIRNSFVGLGAGAVVDDTEADGTEGKVAGVLTAGFDIPFKGGDSPKDTFSIGADADYLIVDEDTNAFTVNGVVKYWY